MNKDELVIELNSLLKDKHIDLPSYRKEVTTAGKNITWLINNIKTRNYHYNSRIDDLLTILSRS